MSVAHNLLVIDWDYFFPNPFDGGTFTEDTPLQLWDWAHNETPFMRDYVWSTRAGGFIGNGLELPSINDEHRSFWDRFRLAPRARLFYADSNALAVSRKIINPRTKFASVWLYDAHHDAGYGGVEQTKRLGEIIRKGEWDCGYWMILYWTIGAALHVRYPRWKVRAFDLECEPAVPGVDRAMDDGATPDVTFDRVFVCRSGAWVPPWNEHDMTFLSFVDAAPVREKIKLESVEPRHVDDAKDLLVEWRQQREQMLALLGRQT